jgi:uncharacterized membrane protein YfhO
VPVDAPPHRWQARLDGRPAPLSLLEDAFLSIPVPAGDHSIEFFFQSASLTAGAVVSFCGLLLLLLVKRFPGITGDEEK